MKSEKVLKLIESCKKTFAAVNGAGSAPVVCQVEQPRKTVLDNLGEKTTCYFVISLASQLATSLHSNPNICFVFTDSKSLFSAKSVALRGTAEISVDYNLKTSLWLGDDKKLFKQGISDPDLGVIIFTPDSARIIDGVGTYTDVE